MKQCVACASPCKDCLSSTECLSCVDDTYNYLLTTKECVLCSTYMPRCSNCLQESVCTACTTTGGPFYLSYPPSNLFFISKINVSHVNKHDLIVWHVHRLQESVQHVQLVRTSFTWKTTVVFPVLPVVLFVQVRHHVPHVSTRLLLFIIKCVLLAVNLFPTVSNAAVQPHVQCVQTIQLWTQVEVRFLS